LFDKDNKKSIYEKMIWFMMVFCSDFSIARALSLRRMETR
jgi:hypothetical protein